MFLLRSVKDATSKRYLTKLNQRVHTHKFYDSLSTTPLSGQLRDKDEFDMEGEGLTEKFPLIQHDIAERAHDLNMGSDYVKRLNWMLGYNVLNTGKVRAEWAMMAYKMLEKPENLTPENIKLAKILGLCIMMLECFTETYDDIMDESETRRGKVSWHRVNGVGIQAINDSVILNSCVYFLLNKHLGNRQCYSHLVTLFNDIIFHCVLAQASDMSFGSVKAMEGNAFERHTLDSYRATAKGISGGFFYLPVATAMYLADIYEPKKFSNARNIGNEIGYIFLVQDDFLDIDEDSVQGKIRWPILVAYEKATPTQKKLIEKHYGHPDDRSVQIIKDIYKDIDIASIYAKYEKKHIDGMYSYIEEVSQDLPSDLFIKFIEKLRGRQQDL